MESNIPRGVPFSLVCEQCDAGMEIESYEQAQAQGWIGIVYAPDLPMANFVGLCPECRSDDESFDRAREEA